MNMQFVIEPNSDQINADELQNGQKLVVTIADVMIRGGQEQPVAMRLVGMDKVYRPCKSMCRVLVAAWGLDAKEYVGRSLELYTDPTVKFGPLAVGGLRISRMSHIDGPMQMALTATKGIKKAYKVMPLTVAAEAKPDKVLDGVKALLARIAAGEDIDDDDAANAQRKWLEANRPELFKQIEDALAARGDDPFAEGPTTEDRGESHAFDADQIIGFINKKVTVIEVNSLVASHTDTIAGFSEDDRARVADAQAAKIEAIKGGAE